MISVTDLRSGATFTEEGQIFKVLKYEHTKMGRGTATIKVKIKNLKTGSTTEKSFISGARVQETNLEKKEVQYLYSEGRGPASPAGGSKVEDRKYIFMDPRTFEQFTIFGTRISDEAKFLQDGINVQVMFWNGEPLSIELPIKMDFKVVVCDPGVKGNSATNIYKDATLENGLRLKVPLFIQEGQAVRIDTRTGEYVERVGK
ncbi:elongation factor P [Candidatus Gottesmanbacteria bacterium]|nr:elongation factor P [Candidatus Gottesmanbacteria bacterium]